jgi:hypothetical protein
MPRAGLVTSPNGKAGATDLGMNKNTYRGHRIPPAIIPLTVWMYARFTLSLRDVEELLAERGLDISYETVRRCSSNLRRERFELVERILTLDLPNASDAPGGFVPQSLLVVPIVTEHYQVHGQSTKCAARLLRSHVGSRLVARDPNWLRAFTRRCGS